MRLTIGSRGSALALWQAEHVQRRLRESGHQVEIQVIVTTGDRIQDRRLEEVGGKGTFLKEIEEAMLAGQIDLAVHSLKDVPTALPDGLVLAAVLTRADPRDALLMRDGGGLSALPKGARVGTTSLRRESLLRALRPELEIVDLRGNVDTRIRRLAEGDFDAIVLAMAGLVRLGRQAEISEALDPALFVPAPGQGAIAIEVRAGDAAVANSVAFLDHPATARAVRAERAFLAAFGAGCNVPLGAHASAAGAAEPLRLQAFVAEPHSGELRRGVRSGHDPAALGQALAAALGAAG